MLDFLLQAFKSNELSARGEGFQERKKSRDKLHHSTKYILKGPSKKLGISV